MISIAVNLDIDYLVSFLDQGVNAVNADSSRYFYRLHTRICSNGRAIQWIQVLSYGPYAELLDRALNSWGNSFDTWLLV